MSNSYSKVINLPSKGLLYEGELSAGVVELKGFSYGDQVKLCSITSERGLYDLLDEQLISPKGVSLRDLLPQDFFYVLLAYRSFIFGKDYSFETECPKCEESVTVDLDVDTYVDSSVELDDVPELKAVLGGKEVTFKLLTMRDDENVKEIAKRNSRRFKTEYRQELYKCRHIESIVEIDGVVERPQEKQMFLMGLQGREGSMIDSIVSSVDFGADGGYELVCPYCGKRSSIVFPVTVAFFRAAVEREN